MEEGTKRKKGKCPISGISCAECGYPTEYCPIYLLVEALQDIARALESENEQS
jgi:Na+-translocating ferredoxin:NAD+ oxidoreductase RnfC subunit